jgi:hypothetical protein
VILSAENSNSTNPVWVYNFRRINVFIVGSTCPRQRYVIPLYIGLFSMIGVFIGAFFTQFGLVCEINFHFLLRFPIWYLWFSAALWHYRKLSEKEWKTSG